jgi:hypothetical protein
MSEANIKPKKERVVNEGVYQKDDGEITFTDYSFKYYFP